MIQCDYVGGEQDVSMQTIDEMEPIDVGGVQGLLLPFGQPPEYGLMWVRDGVLYQADYHNKDELLRIAESIG